VVWASMVRAGGGSGVHALVCACSYVPRRACLYVTNAAHALRQVVDALYMYAAAHADLHRDAA